jgi:hypothetical protein
MESPSMLAPTANVVGLSPRVPLVHRYYLLLKAHFFLFFSAFGMLYPVLSITLRSRGLSNTEISYINLIIPFIVFFTNPLMGFIADHSRRYLLTFNFILAIVTISYCFMFLLPSMKTHHIQAELHLIGKSEYVLDFCASQEVATKCSSRSGCGCSYNAYCKKTNYTFTMSSTDTRQIIRSSIDLGEPSLCGIEYRVPFTKYIQNSSTNITDYNTNTSLLATCEITCSIAQYCHGIRYPQQTVYILLYSLLFIVGTNLLSNAITIGASIGFAALPRSDIFGQQRVWGTIGFGISAFAASRLNLYFKTDFVYIIMFSITSVVCILITSFIRIQPLKQKRNSSSDETGSHEEEMTDLTMEENEKIKKKSQSKIAALIPLLKKIDVIIFLSLTFIWGMSYAGLDPVCILFKPLLPYFKISIA